MFQGENTLNQLEKIIEVTGMPNKDDIKSIKSRFTSEMLENVNVKKVM